MSQGEIRVPSCLLLWIVQLFVSLPAAAQSNDELNGSFQFNFHTPGARSLALGRAFTGRADDATAAYANPAGLIWLSLPETSIEGRWSSYSTEHVDGGRANGEPTGLGIDTVDHVIFGATDRETVGLSFLSAVYPFGEKKKWRVALYRHELANFEAAVDRSEGVFFALPRERPNRVNHGRVNPVQADLSLGLVNYGLSVAWEATGQLWIGAGISYYDFSLDSIWEGFIQPSPNPTDPSETSFSPAVFSPGHSGGTRLQSGEDYDQGGILGVLWHTPADRWSLGVVYRQGPEFDFSFGSWRREFDQVSGTFEPSAPCGQFSTPPQVPCGALGPEGVRRGEFRVPDVFSFGVSYRPVDRWAISFEYDRITYSDLQPTVNVLAIAQPPEIELDEFEIEDGDEFHLGVERILSVRRTKVYLRAGAWHDPAHQLEFNDRPPLSTTVADGQVKPTNDRVRLDARFPGGSDEIHWSGGVGLSWERLQIDAAVDLSDRSDIGSLSAIFRF